MERMAGGSIELNDNEVFHNCSYSCYANLADALNMLRGYEDTGLTPEKIKSLQGVYAVFMKAMAEGRLVELPCKEFYEKAKKAADVLESICENCGFEAGSKECEGCAIDMWRKGESDELGKAEKGEK